MHEGDLPAFASDGRESFQPTYEDNKDVRNFSDENRWPTRKLIGRLALYTAFIERLDIMPRAKRAAERIISHIDFELPYRGLYLDFDFENEEDDAPSTVPIDKHALRSMLDDDDKESPL